LSNIYIGSIFYISFPKVFSNDVKTRKGAKLYFSIANAKHLMVLSQAALMKSIKLDIRILIKEWNEIDSDLIKKRMKLIK
jgi:hypothetical protein